jgi:hypothetical protein
LLCLRVLTRPGAWKFRKEELKANWEAGPLSSELGSLFTFRNTFITDRLKTFDSIDLIRIKSYTYIHKRGGF